MVHLSCAAVGIIPARAGSTRSCPSTTTPPRDHPRSRGEHGKNLQPDLPDAGSSPLARGAQVVLAGHDAAEGIIPARAGSTGGVLSGTVAGGDHPRSRGEHAKNADYLARTLGSSPLARGAPNHASPPSHSAGIIPARAGSTRRRSPPGLGRRDHPRSRGEHLIFEPDTLILPGSSPLARGARHGRPARNRKPGIIPARAGSTLPCACRRREAGDHPRSRGEHCHL